MEGFVFHILKLNLIVSLVILMAVGVSRVRKNKYSARWKYVMWLAVCLVLLVPAPPSGDGLVRLEIAPRSRTAVSGSGSVPAAGKAGGAVGSNGGKAEAEPGPASRKDRLSEKKVNISSARVSWYGILEIFGRVWLAGVAVLGLYRIVQYRFSMGSLQRWAMPVKDEGIKRMYRYECMKKHVKNPPKLMVSSKLSSPVLAGLLSTKLYYTDSDYSLEELQLVFSHELSHYRSGDLWYKMLLMVVTTVYWFNPFLYLMQKEAEKDIENLRDSSVVERCDPEEQKRYQFLLLKTATLRQDRVPYLSASLNDSTLVFKERILYMRNRKALKRGTLPAAVLTGALLFSNVAVNAAIGSSISQDRGGSPSGRINWMEETGGTPETSRENPPQGGLPEPEASNDGEARISGQTGLYAASDLNIRSGPGTEYEILGSVPVGEALRPTGNGENGWIEVSWDGERAYVLGELVTEEENPNRGTAGNGEQTAEDNGEAENGRGQENVPESIQGNPPENGGQNGIDVPENQGAAGAEGGAGPENPVGTDFASEYDRLRQQGGTLEGTVVSRDSTGLDLQTDDGNTHHFLFGDWGGPIYGEAGDRVSMDYIGSLDETAYADYSTPSPTESQRGEGVKSMQGTLVYEGNDTVGLQTADGTQYDFWMGGAPRDSGLAAGSPSPFSIMEIREMRRWSA